MKSKFLFVMSVAASMLLVSCNNTPSISSMPGETSGDATSAIAARVISVSCDTTEADLQLNATLDLNVTVAVEGGASKIAEYSSSNPDVASVNDSGRVTGKAIGDATITIKAKADPTKFCEVLIHVVGVQYDAIGGLKAGQTATVKGKCIATNTKSFILADASGAVMVYLNAAPSQEIGKIYQVKGTLVASAYSAGFTQFDNTAEIEEVAGETMDVPAAIDLTAEIANGWKAACDAATDKAAQYLDQDAMKLYKWETTVSKSGNYFVTKIAGSDVVIEPVYMDNKAFTLVEGKKYNVEGVYAGYRVPSSGEGYAQIVLTSAVEKAAEVGDVSLATAENARVVKVGADLELTASINGVENGAVTWSLKEEGASAYATLTADAENANKAVLHGVAAGKVTVVATYGEKKAELEITVESNAVAKTLAECNTKDEIVAVDVVVAALGYQGYVIADATGHVFVYDTAHTPAVGDHLHLEAKVGARYGGKQFTVNKYEVAEGAAPTAPAAMPMTEAIGLALTNAVREAKDESTFMAATEAMPIGLYKWDNVLIYGSGNYLKWDVGSAHFETNNTADANKPEAGKNYDLEGVVYAYYKDGDIEFVTVVVTKAVEHAAETGTVTIEGAAEVQVGASVELTASVLGGGDVTWSLKEEGADAIATLANNGNAATITGVAAGSVTVVATCGEKSAEHVVTVKAAPAKEHGTLENPISVAAAKSLIADLEDPTSGGKYDSDMLYVTGEIVAVTYSWNGQANKSGSYTIKDAGADDSEALDAKYIYMASDIVVGPAVGETVVIRGYACKYLSSGKIINQISAPNGAGADTRATVMSISNRNSVALTQNADEHATIVGLAANAELGSTASFTVTVAEGYEIDSVKANNDALTAVDGAYSFVVKGETTVTVTTKVAGEVPPAVSEVITFAAGTDMGTTDANGSADSITKGVITIDCSDAAFGRSDNYRVYKNATLTISAAEGKLIEKIELTSTANTGSQYGPHLIALVEGAAGAYETDAKVGTWTGSAATVTFSAAQGQARFTQIVVTLAA